MRLSNAAQENLLELIHCMLGSKQEENLSSAEYYILDTARRLDKSHANYDQKRDAVLTGRHLGTFINDHH